MIDALVTIMRTEGGLSLYRGFAPALIGTAPFAALNFASYDLMKKYLFDADIRSAAYRSSSVLRMPSMLSMHASCSD